MYSLYILQISCQTHLIYNKKIGKLQVGTAGGKNAGALAPAETFTCAYYCEFIG